MSEKPVYSIVIPVYNGEKTIESTLESIRRQTFSDYEVIIVNDGSTDRSEKVIQQWIANDERFHLLTVKNGGPGHARNYGMARMKGTYLIFVDADDHLTPETLETYNEAMTDHPDLLIASYECDVLNNGEVVGHEVISVEDKLYTSQNSFYNDLYELMQKRLINVIWNKVYRTAIIQQENIGFPTYSSCEDRIFNMLYFAHVKKVRLFSRIMYHYHFDAENSLTNRFVNGKFESFVEFFKRVGEVCPPKDRPGVQALFLKGVMSCFLSLHHPTCSLNRREKFDYIKRVLSHQKVIEASQQAAENTWLRRLFAFLFKQRMATLNYVCSWLLYISSTKLPRLVERLKKTF